MLGNLTNKLANIFQNLKGKIITEEHLNNALKELKIALIESDVSLDVVKKFINNIQDKALGQEVIKSVTPDQMIVSIVHEELVKTLSDQQFDYNINFKKNGLTSILILGTQGSGKTTSAAKLALKCTKLGKKVLLCSVDVYRPAAIEQLELLANQIGVDFYKTQTQKPKDILLEALQYLNVNKYDVFILDTAGRSTIDQDMISELKSLNKILNADENLLVIDVLVGQEGINIIKAFNESIILTGAILSRADSDAKGGIALSLKSIINKPIKFLGVSEKVDGLEEFNAESFASRILDMGDVVSLVAKAKEAMEVENEEEELKKLAKGKFNLVDYLSYTKKMQKMGNVKTLLSKLPGTSQLINSKMAELDQVEVKIRKQQSIIYSMTMQERKYPAVINGSRKRRIAEGSGTSIQEVNHMLKQFKQISKVMKTFSKNPKSMMSNFLNFRR